VKGRAQRLPKVFISRQLKDLRVLLSLENVTEDALSGPTKDWAPAIARIARRAEPTPGSTTAT